MIFNVATTLSKYNTYRGTFSYRKENIVSLQTTQLSLKINGSDIPKQALFLTEFP